MKHKWLFAATIGTAVIVAPVVADASIKDVKVGSEMETAVQSLLDRNVMSLYSDGSFKPNKVLTRAEVAKIIAKSLQLDTKNVKDPGLKDVSKSNPNYKYIAAIAEAGIMTGNKGIFNPNKNVTRGQIAKILNIAYDLQLSKDIYLPFVDVKEKQTATYVKTLLAYNITEGIKPDRFGVNDSVKRGQLALFIHRVEKYKSLPAYDETVTGSVVKLSNSQFDAQQIRVANESSYYNDGVIKATLSEGGDTITFEPLKEGTANFAISAFSVDIDGENYYSYQFDVKKVNGKLQVTMSLLNKFLDYPVMLESGNYKGVELFDLNGKKLDVASGISQFDEETLDVWVVAPAGFYKAKLTTLDNTVVEKMYMIHQDPVFATANPIQYFDGDEVVIQLNPGISNLHLETYTDGVTHTVKGSELRIKTKSEARLNFTYTFKGETHYLTGDIYTVGDSVAIAEHVVDVFKKGTY